MRLDNVLILCLHAQKASQYIGHWKRLQKIFFDKNNLLCKALIF